MIVASSDVEDLTAVYDRVVVLRAGRVAGELTCDAVEKTRLSKEMVGAHLTETRSNGYG